MDRGFAVLVHGVDASALVLVLVEQEAQRGRVALDERRRPSVQNI